jgi:antitoxin (DNA-binding transcriptional repressor) of toxin-antitoxin stability system
MIELSVRDMETNLPGFLAELAKGSTIVLVDGNVPIAEVRPLPPQPPKEPRPVGLARPTFRVPPSFFEPLSDELLDAFEGKSQ